jgi:ankyrin repeat protein
MPRRRLFATSLSLLCLAGCRAASLPPAALVVDEHVVRAVRAHDAASVMELLRQGKLRDPNTAVRAAVEAGDVSILRVLSRPGFDPNLGVGTNVESLLSTATRLGHEEMVGFLLSVGADPNGRAGLDAAYPPLFEAVRSNHVRVAALLLENHADPNARISIDQRGVRRGRDEGPTLLMLAAAAGCPDMVDLLIAWGAVPDSRDWAGRTAVDWAGDYVSPVPRIRATLAAAVTTGQRK